ncbi:MAG TPA: glycosyltransferase [Pyrinomonadaceae bacterium]|nr:glycosyltransferase [Pyrinomonadaceae bacterium]
MEVLRPRVIVELGTFTGVSYCAFCQAVKELNLDTRCYAVDTWRGDEQSGFYDGQEILRDLQKHHDPLYGDFSSLIESTFDRTVSDFEDGSIELLHIDGYHTYDSVRHDFETWLPKMSKERGFILLHDISERERDFGVWKLWDELTSNYRHFDFTHEHGLGLLAIGSDLPALLIEIISAADEERRAVRRLFSQLGQRLRMRLDRDHEVDAISWQVDDLGRQMQALQATINVQQATIDSQVKAIDSQLATIDSQLVTIDSQQETIRALSAEVISKETRLDLILNTRSWRWVNRLGRIKMRYFEPAYRTFIEPLRRLETSGGHKKFLAPQTPLAPKECWRDPLKQLVVLLPGAESKHVSKILEETSGGTLNKADVVCFSIVDWDFRYQRPQQIMSQFAEQGHRVFYIKLKEVRAQSESPRFSIKEIKRNLYEITLAAVRQPRINQEVVEGLNADSLLESLNELRHACRIEDAIGYVMTPSWTAVSLSCRERWNWRVVYDCMDEWDGFPGVIRTVTRVEGQLVQNCDLLVVSAAKLLDKWQNRSGASVLVRNAVDYEYYAKRHRPNELLKKDSRPLIGYFGAIADWFDIDLMTDIASARPDYSFVLLGGVFDVDVGQLASLPNVQLLGQQPYATMPQYLYHFVACLIPFKLNRITHATDPVKMYEYLSAGKPVVAVALDELQPFGDYIYIARNRDEYLEKLDSAVMEQDEELKEHRREFAKNNTWQHRYETIRAALSAAVPPASIVVVTYNNLGLSRLCLESILRNTDHLNYEVVVVDNNSTDGTPEHLTQLAAKHPYIQVILNGGNEGFAKATNQGISASSGERIVLLNNDTVVPPGWLNRLLKHLDDPEVGLVGPVTNFVGNEAKVDVDYGTWAEMEATSEERYWNGEGASADIRMLAMFCVAMRRDTFERIGPLDEQFGIGMFEDDDYTERVRAAGYRVVCAGDTFVHHFGQAAFKTLIERGEYAQLFDENRQRFEAKWSTRWMPHQNGELKFKRGLRQS